MVAIQDDAACLIVDRCWCGPYTKDAQLGVGPALELASFTVALPGAFFVRLFTMVEVSMTLTTFLVLYRGVRKGETLMRSWIAGAMAAGCIVAGAGVAPAVAGPTTTVHLRVTGCEGCTFVAHDGRTWERSWRKVATSTPVTKGKATITVPRKNTPTTSLEVVHPDGLGAQNATAFVAFSWKKSAGSWTGGICWGKQKGASARLHIVVTEFTGRAVPGAPKERFIRARLAKLPTKAQAGVNGSPGCPRYAGSSAG